MSDFEKFQRVVGTEGYQPRIKPQVPDSMEKQGGYQPPKDPKTVSPPPKKP